MKGTMNTERVLRGSPVVDVKHCAVVAELAQAHEGSLGMA